MKGGNLTETFNVIQTATEGLDLETVLFEDISAAGGTITVKVMTNGEPTITINDSWITEKTETRAMVDKTKTLSSLPIPEKNVPVPLLLFWVTCRQQL